MVAPLIAAAGIQAGTQIVGSAIGGKGAQKAAKIQAQAVDKQIAQTNQYRADNDARYAPDIEQANRANEIYSGLIGTGSDPAAAEKARDAWLGSSNYKFVRDQANDSINASAYANGMSRSGAALKRLADRSADLANGYQQQYLANVDRQVGYGSTAKAALAGADSTALAAINNATQTGAAASGNASLAQGASWANTTNNIGTLLGGLIKGETSKTTTSSYGGR